MLDPDIQRLVTQLNQIPAPDRGNTIKKLELFAKSDAKPFQIITNTLPNGRTSTRHLPALSRMDVVHCNFTGVGYEWDGPHYAVVWNANPAFDSVTVIPTTSESREEHANVFSVNQLTGMPPGQTTLLVGDTTTVSRKRLDQVLFKHPKKGTIQSVKVPMPWLNRIIQAMAVTFGGEITFQELVINQTGTAMPSDLSLLYAWRFIPVKGNFNQQTNELSYRIWNSDVPHKEQFVLPKQQISVQLKKDLLRNLLSNDPNVRSAAEAQYVNLYP